MTDVIYAILALAVLLAAVSILLPIAERSRLPFPVILVLFGMGLGALGQWTMANGVVGIGGDLFWGLRRIGLGADTFLYLFLPPLLFTAGLTIDVRRLFDEFAAVLLLAVVAVLVCILFVGALLHWVTGVDIVVCLLLGAIVSTTDPAAVIGILRDVGAPKRLSILCEGEALFNDAAAITTFTILISILVGRSMPDAATPVLNFLRDFIGGMVLGWALARVAILVLTRVGDSIVGAASVTMSVAYLAFVLGDHYLHVSGVVAVVVAALTMAARGPTSLQPRVWEGLVHIWHQLDFWANALIFMLAAMVAYGVLWQINGGYLVALAALVLAAFSARILVLFGLLPVLERFSLVQAVDARYKTMIVWGGLRGAVTVVLALVAANNDRLSEDVRQFVAVLATLFVLFTLFINAPTLRPLMRFFGLDKLTRTEVALRDRVMALSRATVARQVYETAKAYGAERALQQRLPHLHEAATADRSATEAQAHARDSEMQLSHAERLEVGLLTLSNRERELYLEHFDQQTLSRHTVSLLVAGADRLIDRVKTEGAKGYELALRRTGEIDGPFRLALWLHRRFGWQGPLGDRLADRFETLLVQSVVLEELIEFNRHTMAPLLGQHASTALSESLEARQAATERALKALSLQYAGYAETVRTQHLERAALRFEAAEYERQMRSSTIGSEVYRELQAGMAARRAAASVRPQLDLGLGLQEMIGRVPLFGGLDTDSVRRVARRLRPQLAVPGETIVRRGERGESMYFIAAGEVTVRLAHGEVTLKGGDFFGEMALVDRMPRNADVVALGYCHLLVLEARDFRTLLSDRPDLRAEIEAVAHARRSQPVSAPASGDS
jgi:CPA1 family monovalent cation:H+ antiporter